ncbi:hypothetical protein A9Q89_03655 [Gammaproteobacteria bacterium 53_120_T64]|nr:hypothetical protein A9Q89_03655 [Gammaproteobacteria bacterium 53_120_T64]
MIVPKYFNFFKLFNIKVVLSCITLILINTPISQGATNDRNSRGIEIKEKPSTKGTSSKENKSIYDSIHALVIGINEYDDRRIPSLQYAINDASSILKTLEKTGVASSNIIFIEGKNATKTNILSAIKNTLKNRLKENDGLVVFFAGHGVHTTRKKISGEVVEQGYLLPYNAKNDQISSTAISLQLLNDLLMDLPAKHVLLTIDACYSGFALNRSSNNSFISSLASKQSRFVITAGGKGEQALEVAGHGIFTEKLIEGLSGFADLDIDGFVTASELGTYLKSAVSKSSNGSQTPIFGSLYGEGEFIFDVKRSRPGYRKEMRKALTGKNLYDSEYDAGLYLFDQGKYKEAKNRFKKALMYRPSDYWASQKITYINAFQPLKESIVLANNTVMHLIKADSFVMGNNLSHTDQEKPRRIEFIQDFYISSNEVSLKEYSYFLEQNKTVSPPLYFDIQSSYGDLTLPVQGISWDQADLFCRYYGANLPTEKEWEYTARGSSGKRYITGSNIPNNDITNWYNDNKYRNISPPGRFPLDKTEQGIYDMMGNVKEWVRDVDDGYILQQIPVDKTGRSYKVVRGANYKTRSTNMLQLSNREFRYPNTGYIGIGFRCSKTPSIQDYE